MFVYFIWRICICVFLGHDPGAQLSRIVRASKCSVVPAPSPILHLPLFLQLFSISHYFSSSDYFASKVGWISGSWLFALFSVPGRHREGRIMEESSKSSGNGEQIEKKTVDTILTSDHWPGTKRRWTQGAWRVTAALLRRDWGENEDCEGLETNPCNCLASSSSLQLIISSARRYRSAVRHSVIPC